MWDAHVGKAATQAPEGLALLQEHVDADKMEGCEGCKLLFRYGVQFDREGAGRDNRSNSNLKIPGVAAGIVGR